MTGILQKAPEMDNLQTNNSNLNKSSTEIIGTKRKRKNANTLDKDYVPFKKKRPKLTQSKLTTPKPFPDKIIQKSTKLPKDRRYSYPEYGRSYDDEPTRDAAVLAVLLERQMNMDGYTPTHFHPYIV
eukprot:TRINITY_DN506_c0_g1_i2.p1 TRINITY_DN506_c0_g1~~TRINITY_DN506_c0_g1_i2.p1  ORF type:complete len:127 (-),score=17.63 TRINITY_DN506_c0_g1_i2:92-472(-)